MVAKAPGKDCTEYKEKGLTLLLEAVQQDKEEKSTNSENTSENNKCLHVWNSY